MELLVKVKQMLGKVEPSSIQSSKMLVEPSSIQSSKMLGPVPGKSGAQLSNSAYLYFWVWPQCIYTHIQATIFQTVHMYAADLHNCWVSWNWAPLLLAFYWIEWPAFCWNWAPYFPAFCWIELNPHFPAFGFNGTGHIC